MAARTRAGFQIVVWFAAANFALLVVAALVLLVTGTVGASRLGAAVEVLRGSADAVPADELAALREARETLAGRGKEADLMTAWAGLRAREAAFEGRKSKGTAMLQALAGVTEKDLKAISSARRSFESERKKEDLKREQRMADLKRTASEKVRRVYRYMRPAEVARDLEARLESGRADEVAEILRMMNDRTAAEILEAIADPANRMRIYDALAGITAVAGRP